MSLFLACIVNCAMAFSMADSLEFAATYLVQGKSPKEDITGQKFGKLTVLYFAGRNNKSLQLWACKCECGNEVVVWATALRRNNTRSCGCMVGASLNARRELHGKHELPEYEIWKAMKARCLNPNNKKYSDYGGRGIVICDTWLNSFATFLQDMGARTTPKHTLERREVNGNYEPKNCFWATWKQQQRNRRDTRFVEYKGGRISMQDLAEDKGIPSARLRSRLDKGWDVDRAVEEPQMRKGRSAKVPC